VLVQSGIRAGVRISLRITNRKQEANTMSDRHESQLPDDLREIGERLRAERPEVSALDLDRIKLRAMADASSSHTRGGTRLRSRTLAAILTIALMAGGTGGVIATTSNGNGGSASNSVYKPGCGPPPDGVDGAGHTHTGPDGKPHSDCYGNSGH